MRYNTHQAHFGAGELGEQFINRVDLPQYKNGLQECENFFPTPVGSMSFREGLRFKCRDLYSSSATTNRYNQFNSGLFPFIKRDGSEALVHIYPVTTSPNAIFVTFYDSGLNYDTDSIGGGALTTVLYTSTSGHGEVDSLFDFSDAHYAQIGSVLIVTQADGLCPPIFAFESPSTSYEAVFWGTAGASTKLWNIKEYIKSIPFSKYNSDEDIYLAMDAAASVTDYTVLSSVEQKTVTAYNAANTPISDFFTPEQEGAFYRLVDQTTEKETIIQITNIGTGATSASASCTTFIGFASTLAGTGNKTNEWARSAWNQLDGYPRTICYYNQRLCFGGTKSEPDKIWASSVGDYLLFLNTRLFQDLSEDASGLNFFGSMTNADAFDFRIASDRASYIRFLVSAHKLFIGTENGEFFVHSQDGVFGKDFINVEKRSTIGCSNVMPILLDDSIIFVSKNKKELYRYFLNDSGDFFNVFSFNSDILRKIPDENLYPYLADSDYNIKKLAWDKVRSCFYCITETGDIFTGGVFFKEAVSLSRFIVGGDSVNSPWSLAQTAKAKDVVLFDNKAHFVIARTSSMLSGTEGDLYNIEYLDYPYKANELINYSDELTDKPIFLDGAQSFDMPLYDSGADFTIDIAATVKHLVFTEDHFYYLGQAVQLSTTGTLPTGLSTGTTYYISNYYPYDNGIGFRRTFLLYTTLADAIADTNRVSISSAGSGTHTLTATIPDLNTKITTFAGFNNLIGQNVSYLADGVYGTGSIGSDPRGILTLTTSAAKVIVGLPYEGFLKTMPIEGGGQGGVSRGNITRVDRINVSFYKTYSGKYGSDENDMRSIPFDGELFTGDKTLDFPVSPDRIINVMIKQDQPLPMTVLGMTIRGVSNEG